MGKRTPPTLKIPAGRALASEVAKALANLPKNVTAEQAMAAAQAAYAGKNLSPMEAMYHWSKGTKPDEIPSGAAAATKQPAAQPATQPTSQATQGQSAPSLADLANTPVEGDLPAEPAAKKPAAGGDAGALAGRKLPSKKTMVGALSASGQYTPTEVRALEKKGIKALGEEYLRYEAARSNDPSSGLLPDPPKEAAAPKSKRSPTRGSNAAQAEAADALAPPQKEKPKGKGKQQKLERLDDADDGMDAAGQQQQPKEPVKPKASNKQLTGTQEQWVERTGRNKPTWASMIDHVDRNLYGYGGLAAAAGASFGLPLMFNKGEQQSSNYDPGMLSAPMTPDYLDDYRDTFQMMQQGQPQRNLLEPPPFHQMQPPPEPEPQDPPQGIPNAAPPQSTDIIRMLMQRGQV
jgi:hypothetical protein